jgi:hypothetical protein
MTIWRRLFGGRGTPSPAEAWRRRRNQATPEEVIRQYFAAMAAHDLEWLLATMAPERARLYSDVRTTDKQRLSVAAAEVLAVEPVSVDLPLPAFVRQYRLSQIFKVEFELQLVPPEQRRDPTLREGRQWSYFVLVSAGPGKPWLIADWGR